MAYQVLFSVAKHLIHPFFLGRRHTGSTASDLIKSSDRWLKHNPYFQATLLKRDSLDSLD